MHTQRTPDFVSPDLRRRLELIKNRSRINNCSWAQAIHERARIKRAKEEARRIPAAVRRDVYDEGVCAYCDDEFPSVIDHVIPVSQGGTRRRRNLRMACGRCNREKGELTPEQWKMLRLSRGHCWPPLSRMARILHAGGELYRTLVEAESAGREISDADLSHLAAALMRVP